MDDQTTQPGQLGQTESLKDAVDIQLGAAFGMELPKEDIVVIEDMLAWQTMMDNASASINMRGTRRLFATIAHHLDRNIYLNNSPDPTEITIPLTDTVGIQIKAEAWSNFDSQPEPGEPEVTWNGHLDIRFVDLTGKKWYTA